MNAVLTFLSGKKTYGVALVLALVVIVEKGLGIDVPGVAVGDDWLVLLLNAAGLSTLRAGVESSVFRALMK